MYCKMMSFNFFVIILGFYIVYSQETPNIVFITKSSINDVGDSVELICSVLHAEELPIFWIKINKDDILNSDILSVKNTMVIRNQRMSLQHDIEKYSYTLKIKDLQETDRGLYQCQVLLNLVKKITADVEIIIRQAPMISDNSSRSLIVLEGKPVLLECYAGGYPKPAVSWRKYGNPVLPIGGWNHKDNILRIPSIQKEDRGTYFCIAENGVGKGARRKVEIQVQFSPVVTVPKDSISRNRRKELELNCHIESFPLPVIIWMLNGMEIQNNRYYSISHTVNGEDVIDSCLHIDEVQIHHYGKYTCKALNIIGTGEASVVLHS